MALLIGQEEEAAGTAVAPITEIAWATRWEVKVSGTVEALHITFSSNLSTEITSVRLAVVADAAGPKPKASSALIEGVKASPGAVKTVEVSGLSLAVTKGEFVWLAFETLGGPTCKIKPGAVNYLAKNGSKKAQISEATWLGATSEQAPMSIWATGPEAGAPLSGKATGTVLFTGTAAGATTEVLKGKATGRLSLTGTAKGQTTELLKGKATGRLTFGGTAKGAVGGAVVGKATGRLTFTGAAKGTAKEAASRKTIIFVFDE